MKDVEFWVSFNFGAWHITFTKKFQLNFAPFYDLMILDESDDNEVQFELRNTEYQNTVICYYSQRDSFVVDVHNKWANGTDADNIDQEIDRFLGCGWTRRDTTDLDAFRELMIRNYRTNR